MKESRNKKAGLLSLLCALLVIIIDVRTVNAETYEYAMFPSDVVYVSQTAYGSYSHSGKNVTDIVPNSDIKAPFLALFDIKTQPGDMLFLRVIKKYTMLMVLLKKCVLALCMIIILVI